MGLLEQLFSTREFMPHGMCYEWDSRVIFLHVASDAVIALAYYSIPLTLVYFVRKRKDLAFDWMFVCFAVFIVACGTTHFMEILNIWHPTYWLSGVIKAITAVVSLATAFLLIRLVPQALALPSPEQLRHANAALQNEVQERLAAARKVEALNRELLQRANHIQSVNQELESFAYSVSHDLRAPLRHVDGYVSLLQEQSGALDDEGRRYMRKISDSARQMGVLIDDLLAFSGMGRAALKPVWVETREVVEEAREELAPEEKGRSVAWHIGPLPRVYADRGLFKQVWMNLLGNALKYSRRREQAEITVSCRELPLEYEFSVQDNGAGFDMRYADKLFGIFQRLHLKEEFDGTGIGLANVHRIVTRHGGRTWGHGEPDHGRNLLLHPAQNRPRGLSAPLATASAGPRRWRRPCGILAARGINRIAFRNRPSYIPTMVRPFPPLRVLLFAILLMTDSRASTSFADFDARAATGKPLTVVFFGGSLTWGANASDPQKTSYRARMGDYLRRKYPKSSFDFIDAAIGGTGSKLGLFRLERDVMAYHPDLVFLDFTANDGLEGGDSKSLASYEGLLRDLIGAGVPVEQVFLGFKYNFGKGYNLAHETGYTQRLKLVDAYQTARGDLFPYLQPRLAGGALDIDNLWSLKRRQGRRPPGRPRLRGLLRGGARGLRGRGRAEAHLRRARGAGLFRRLSPAHARRAGQRAAARRLAPHEDVSHLGVVRRSLQPLDGRRGHVRCG